MVIPPHRHYLQAVTKRLIFVLVHGDLFSSGFSAGSDKTSDIMLLYGNFFFGIVSAVIVIVGWEGKKSLFQLTITNQLYKNFRKSEAAPVCFDWFCLYGKCRRFFVFSWIIVSAGGLLVHEGFCPLPRPARVRRKAVKFITRAVS